MGPIWGRQDPGGPHVGPMNFVIWIVLEGTSQHGGHYWGNYTCILSFSQTAAIYHQCRSGLIRWYPLFKGCNTVVLVMVIQWTKCSTGVLPSAIDPWVVAPTFRILETSMSISSQRVISPKTILDVYFKDMGHQGAYKCVSIYVNMVRYGHKRGQDRPFFPSLIMKIIVMAVRYRVSTDTEDLANTEGPEILWGCPHEKQLRIFQCKWELADTPGHVCGYNNLFFRMRRNTLPSGASFTNKTKPAFNLWYG